MRSEFAKLLLSPVGLEFEFGQYQFMRSISQSERASAMRLRQQVYLEEGYIDESACAGGVFTDQFDEISEHLIVINAIGDIVGTTRFVLPTSIGFPTEHLFPITRPSVPLSTIGEFSRLALCETARGGRREPMIGLLKLVYEVMIEREIQNVYAFMAEPLVGSYASLGCVSTFLDTGPVTSEIEARRVIMRGYFASDHIRPVLFRLADMIPAITAP